MANEWYYRKSGQQYGPISASELKQLAQAEHLQPTDYVRKDANADWLPAKNVKGLFEEVQQESPPIAQASLVEVFKPPTTTSATSRQVTSSKSRRSPTFWIAMVVGGGFVVLMLMCGGIAIVGVAMKGEKRVDRQGDENKILTGQASGHGGSSEILGDETNIVGVVDDSITVWDDATQTLGGFQDFRYRSTSVMPILVATPVEIRRQMPETQESFVAQAENFARVAERRLAPFRDPNDPNKSVNRAASLRLTKELMFYPKTHSGRNLELDGWLFQVNVSIHGSAFFGVESQTGYSSTRFPNAKYVSTCPFVTITLPSLTNAHRRFTESLRDGDWIIMHGKVRPLPTPLAVRVLGNNNLAMKVQILGGRYEVVDDGFRMKLLQRSDN